MTARAYLGRYDSSGGRRAYIGIGHDAYDGHGDGVRVGFSLPPKDAPAHVVIEADSFERLAMAMMASHSKAAIKAFGAALHADEDDVFKMFGRERVKREVPDDEAASRLRSRQAGRVSRCLGRIL
jgi:hypothetical protein